MNIDRVLLLCVENVQCTYAVNRVGSRQDQDIGAPTDGVVKLEDDEDEYL